MKPAPKTLGRFNVTVEIEVRPARREDLPALEWMGLYAAHAEIIEEAFAAQERGEAVLVLGIAGGFPVAQVFIDFARRKKDKVAMLWAVRTFFPLQGRGIGRCMMGSAEDVIRRRGWTRAMLSVERDNVGAQRFYRRHGWHDAGPAVETFTVHDAGKLRQVERDVEMMEKTLVAAAPQHAHGVGHRTAH
jgi:GNAT superfamily N-acetyltransferase